MMIVVMVSGQKPYTVPVSSVVVDLESTVEVKKEGE